MYSEKEQAVLSRWREKLAVSMDDLVQIYRLCEGENVDFDDIINYAIATKYDVRSIFKNFIDEYRAQQV